MAGARLHQLRSTIKSYWKQRQKPVNHVDPNFRYEARSWHNGVVFVSLLLSISSIFCPAKDHSRYVSCTSLLDQSLVVPKEIEHLVDMHHLCFIERSVFGTVQGGYGHHNSITSNLPTRSRPYRLNQEEETYLWWEITMMLQLGLIRPSRGICTLPVFFVKKRNGSLRMIIGYRRLNMITIKDTYPLPKVDEVLRSFGNAQWFTTLDAASGYR